MQKEILLITQKEILVNQTKDCKRLIIPYYPPSLVLIPIFVHVNEFIAAKTYIMHRFPSGGTRVPRGMCWAIPGYLRNNQ